MQAYLTAEQQALAAAYPQINGMQKHLDRAAQIFAQCIKADTMWGPISKNEAADITADAMHDDLGPILQAAIAHHLAV